ncbi:bipA [Symbiodinium sp. CCMP2592]|nr:bipA [Symbiodinium sp. CCMP2592]
MHLAILVQAGRASQLAEPFEKVPGQADFAFEVRGQGPSLQHGKRENLKASFFMALEKQLGSFRLSRSPPSPCEEPQAFQRLASGRKTTLVDQLMKQSGMGLKVTERMMDSKDLEQERGITILSKATRISWNGYVFNIVDTPGHADFGGEVERVLSMVDGVVLLVDIVEGPKTQTKFVLQKALRHQKMKPLVVINKVDRPMTRENGEVENDIFDVFANMASTDEQLEYPTLYASGKAGFCARSLEEARSENRPTDMMVLYETIRDVVPPPEPATPDPAILELDEKCKGFSMLVSQLDRLPALGPTVTGKVHSGQIHKGDKISCKSLDGEVVGSGKVREITVVHGVSREPVKMAKAGDIVSVSVTGFTPRWTQTLVSHPKVPPVECQPIDPPVIAVRAAVNDSPLAGKDGKYITLNAVGERLEKEALTNPAIEIQQSPNRDYFEIRGRGEMQLGILIEEMRREGYEMSLSPPSVVKQQGEDGTVLEPWEDVQIEVDMSHGSLVMERMSGRGGKVLDMNTVGERQTIKMEAATSSLLGLRSWLKEVTGGTGTVVSDFKEMRPQGPPAPRDRNGVLIANTAGISTAVDLGKAARMGKLFISEGMEVYPGMIFGENNAMSDIDTNISRKHDGYQSAAGFAPPIEKRLEEALSYILDDEKLEVTPKRIVMRKAILDANERRIAAKAASKRAG